MKIRFSHQDIYDSIARGLINKAVAVKEPPVYITKPLQVNGEKNEYIYRLVFKYDDDLYNEFMVTVGNDWLQVVSNNVGYRFVATYDFYNCKVTVTK